MSSPLDGASLLSRSDTVCRHPVAQMSKTLRPSQVKGGASDDSQTILIRLCADIDYELMRMLEILSSATILINVDPYHRICNDVLSAVLIKRHLGRHFCPVRVH